MSVASLWIPFTIIAALGQVARNAMQRSLTGPLGTWGATNIRFLFGFPFSLIFFAVVIAATGDAVPWPTPAFWPWLLLGALSQIVGTGMMLLAMNDRSFVVTTAYLKTEAIQTAIFGFIFLGDHLTVLKVIAILIATVGVVITALRPGGEKSFAEIKPTIIGLVAAAAFALSALVLYEKFADGVWVHRNPLFLISITCALMGMQNGLGLLQQSLDSGKVVDRPDALVSFEVLHDIMGMHEIEDLEQRFLTPEQLETKYGRGREAAILPGVKPAGSKQVA